MGHLFIVIGAVLAAASVGAGAFGAHGLADRLDPRSLELWETAARYLMYGAFGVIATGILERLWAQRLLVAAAWCLLAGTLVFSGTVFGLAVGAPRVLGAITPLGGLLLIAGFLLLAWAALDRHLEMGEETPSVAVAVEEPAAAGELASGASTAVD
ncbi:MAG TPA: DUF423 domain-containing protein [Thermoanaerobaculia bacterium]